MPLPSSAAFKTAITQSHVIRSRGQILVQGVPSTTSLRVTDGNATDDRNNKIRAKCGVTLIDPNGDLVPDTVDDLLYPGYNEIQLFRGIYLPSGILEEFSLGVFGFDTVQTNNSGQKMAISISGFDRSQRVSDAKFLDETIVSGNVGTIIQSIITPRVPNVSYSFSTTSYSVNQQTYARGDDAWDACVALAKSAGMDLFFDRYGICTMRPFAYSTNADWTLTTDENSVLSEIDKKLVRSQYNHWIEIGEGGNIDTPFSAEAKDQDNIDASGDRPSFHVSSLYTSVGQCQAAANARKAAESGGTVSLQLTKIPNPAMLVDDVLAIVNTRNKINGLYVLDKVTTPLVSITGQNITTRERKA